MTPQQKYYLDNREKCLARSREWAEKNKEYRKQYLKDWYNKNKESIEKTQKVYKEQNRDSINEKAVLRGIRSRSKKRGLPCDLTAEDIKPPEVCPVFGFKLERGSGSGNKFSSNSPSVDRIDPNKGYTKDNIQIISNKANTMKQDATPEELRMFAKWVLKTFPEEQDGKT